MTHPLIATFVPALVLQQCSCAVQGDLVNTVRMFVNGQGMSGGEFNDSFADATFLGEISTAPSYRFFSVRDEFPGLHPVTADGCAVPGEVYELPYLMLAQRLLPREPAELELGIVELADGSGALSMRMRRDALEAVGVEDISDVGGWRAYCSRRGIAFSGRDVENPEHPGAT